MKTSCISHPANEPLIIIRQWQLEFCDDSTAAAALMSFFEYWHNIKLAQQTQSQKANDVAQAHGDDPEADTSLYQWHTHDDIVNALMGVAKSKATVNAAVNLLIAKKIITVHKNPNPRYKFDNTRHFLFYPEVANEWLNNRPSNIEPSSSKNERQSFDNERPANKNGRTSPETTTETTSKIVKEEEEKISKIQKLYQDNIAISLSPILEQEMAEYYHLPFTCWQQAIKAAVVNDARKFSYIRSILENCEKSGLTPEQWQAAQTKPQQRKTERKQPANQTQVELHEAAEAVKDRSGDIQDDNGELDTIWGKVLTWIKPITASTVYNQHLNQKTRLITLNGKAIIEVQPYTYSFLPRLGRTKDDIQKAVDSVIGTHTPIEFVSAS